MSEKKFNWIGSNQDLQAIKENGLSFLNNTVKGASEEEKKTSFSQKIYYKAPAFYLNPTESLIGIQDIVEPGCRFLTVLGSGDFSFEAIFHGARDIVTFDINSNQFYPASLKLKGLQKLDYHRYFEFFSSGYTSSLLSCEQYRELKRMSDSDPVLYAFFDIFMERKGKEEKQQQDQIDKLKRAFSSSDGISFLNTYLGAYLSQSDESIVLKHVRGLVGEKTQNTYIENEDNYIKTQKKVARADFSFVEADLAALRGSLNQAGVPEGYRSIYLSNIPAFFKGDDFYYIVRNQLLPMLEDGGEVVYCCQGVSEQSLTSTNVDIEAKEFKSAIVKPDINSCATVHMINSREAFDLLYRDFTIVLEEVPTFCINNGYDDTDTFVHVRRRKR